jgi:phage-related protein
MTEESTLKPVVWVGSSRKDLRPFPGPVREHLGYALYVAQRGGKHRDAKTLAGFGGAGVLEIVKNYRETRFARSTPCAMLRRCTCSTPSRKSRRRGGRRRDATWN